MDFIISNNLRVKKPSLEFLAWVKTNYSVRNPEYIKKQRLGLWLADTPEYLRIFDIDGEDLILPYGVFESIPIFAWKGTSLYVEFKDNPRVDYNAEIPLYSYQMDALNTMLNENCGILQAPAGSGKTRMGISLFTQMGMKTLWICNKLDLVTQAKNAALEFIDKSLIGTIQGGKVNIGKGVTFATVQTLSKIDLIQFRDTWDVIIVDECHNVSGTTSSLTMYRKVLGNLNARHKYGLSATVHRSDGMIKTTYSLLGKVKYEVPREAVFDKIMKVGIKSIQTNVGLSTDMVGTDGMLNYTNMITSLTNNDDRNKLIVENLIECKDHHVIVLSERVAHLQALYDSLPEELKETAYVVSNMGKRVKDKEKRTRIYNKLGRSKSGYLFATYALAKEGLNIPPLDRVFFTTPIKDKAVVTQAIGRVARIHDGKEDALCYDFVDNYPYSQKAYRQRVSTYKKNESYFVED